MKDENTYNHVPSTTKLRGKKNLKKKNKRIKN